MKVNDDAREKLVEVVAGLTDEEVNWKPSKDKWSVRQILEHLYLMEGGVAKTIHSQLGSGEHHSTPDKPIERAVDRTQKVEAPDFARPGDTFCKLDELKSKLNESHSGLQKIEHTVPADQLEAKSYPHPVFGEMSLAQYIPFVGYHELRHIEQIQEVKDALHATK